MKKLLIMLIFISGCSSNIHEWHLLKAKEMCSDSGIDYIIAYSDKDPLAICKDGKISAIKRNN